MNGKNATILGEALKGKERGIGGWGGARKGPSSLNPVSGVCINHQKGFE